MFQFPPSPIPGQTFTPVAGVTYRWSGTAWHLIAGPGSFLTPTDADTRYVNIEEAQNTTNRIINGKMAIDQRNAGAAVLLSTGTERFGVDRWFGQNYFSAGSFNLQRQIVGGVPQLTTTVATASTPTAGNVAVINHRIEGFNIVDLGFGAAGASPITLAFDVYASNAGNYSVAITNGAWSRSYVAPFTVGAAAWETKVLTIPGDTTGVWPADNSSAMQIMFSLGAGANYTAPAGNVWGAGTFAALAGNINLMGIVNAYIVLRNVRLYKGSVDFGPDRRLYAEELALCQRYYCKTFATDVAPINNHGDWRHGLVGKGLTTGAAEPVANWVFPVAMRTAPSVTLYSVPTGVPPGQWSIGPGTTGANARALTVSDRHAIIDNGDVMLNAASKYLIAATASAEL